MFNICLENSYASNGVKHCIRPCDMTGKSSALILRQMHPVMIKEAEKYDLLVDFPSWFSSLSIDENSIPYSQQKSIEAEALIKISELEKKRNKMFNNKGNKLDDEVHETINDMLQTIELFFNDSEPTSLKRKRGRQKVEY